MQALREKNSNTSTHHISSAVSCKKRLWMVRTVQPPFILVKLHNVTKRKFTSSARRRCAQPAKTKQSSIW